MHLESRLKFLTERGDKKKVWNKCIRDRRCRQLYYYYYYYYYNSRRSRKCWIRGLERLEAQGRELVSKRRRRINSPGFCY
jgi:hypothetical protein